MLTAQGSDCSDFPAPENPVDFSNWSGSHTISESSTTPSYSYGGTVSPSPRGGSTSGGQPSGGTDGQYPPELYAPGAGQGPAPNPGGGSGGGGSGGSGTG